LRKKSRVLLRCIERILRDANEPVYLAYVIAQLKSREDLEWKRFRINVATKGVCSYLKMLRDVGKVGYIPNKHGHAGKWYLK